MNMNRYTVTLLSALAVATLSTAVAADPAAPAAGPMMHGPSPEMFQKMKARILDMQQKRIQVLQQASSCVQAATNMDQIKDCHGKEHQAMMQMHDQMQAERQSMHKRGGN
jgi:hypothetical protein